MDEIEIIKGNDGGSYFWIMPAKTLASSKKYDFYDNTEKMFSEDISIEEDIIFYLLSTYLKNNFDASLIENIERNDTDKIEFECNDANYYTFNAVETIINQIQNDIQKIKTNIFDNASRIESIGRYLYFYMDKDYSEDKKKIFWDNKNCVIDFYNRFISYMKKMMTVAKEKGYELIFYLWALKVVDKIPDLFN